MKLLIATTMLCATAIFCTLRVTAPHSSRARHHYEMHVDSVGNIMRLDTVTGELHYFGRDRAGAVAENWEPPRPKP